MITIKTLKKWWERTGGVKNELRQSIKDFFQNVDVYNLGMMFVHIGTIEDEILEDEVFVDMLVDLTAECILASPKEKELIEVVRLHSRCFHRSTPILKMIENTIEERIGLD